MASTTLSGDSTEIRSGEGPTMTCPDSPSSTTEGVVVWPSALGIEIGFPSALSCARAEYVVPRSIPIVCPSSNFIGPAQASYGVKEVELCQTWNPRKGAREAPPSEIRRRSGRRSPQSSAGCGRGLRPQVESVYSDGDGDRNQGTWSGRCTKSKRITFNVATVPRLD